MTYSKLCDTYSKRVFMKKLEPLFGFECKSVNDDIISVNDMCDYPQKEDNCLKFYRMLEEMNIIDSNIIFPLRLKHSVITINPTDKFTIMNYYKIDGIKKIVEENKSNLIGKITFIKPEVQYPKKAKYPNLHIHFFQVSEDEGMEVKDAEDMITSSMIYYENTKQFTSKRISDLEEYVNTLEIRQMPLLPMEVVAFDNEGNIKDFQQHILALKAVKLPF